MTDPILQKLFSNGNQKNLFHIEKKIGINQINELLCKEGIAPCFKNKSYHLHLVSTRCKIHNNSALTVLTVLINENFHVFFSNTSRM